eukprot:2707264-Pyramimonas_sp.AAC.1
MPNTPRVVIMRQNAALVREVKLFRFDDFIDERSRQAVAELGGASLDSEALRVMILTGDNAESAKKVADMVNLGYDQ